MKRFLVSTAAAAALLLTVSATEADAAGLRLRGRKASIHRTVKPKVVRYRQIDGKSLWDLGKQNGQWPKL